MDTKNEAEEDGREVPIPGVGAKVISCGKWKFVGRRIRFEERSPTNLVREVKRYHLT